MIITEALAWAAQKLQQNHIDSAPLDAELLLCLSLRQTKEFLYICPGRALTPTQLKKFKKLIRRRSEQTPLAYLTGHKEFYGLDFSVNRHVLIPRPVSEAIVEEALKVTARLPARLHLPDATHEHDRRFTVVDIGTGSGCLIIALANELRKKNLLDQFNLMATDVANQALKVAAKNAELHQLDQYITFLKGHLLRPVRHRRLDLIMTNLPYLTKADVKNEPSIKKEPKLALIGDYGEFFKQLKSLKSRPTVIYEDKNGVTVI
ncbi:MAG: Release factor glutamine methyltransferase [Parcubacteria group bacterium GW2011_GWA2_43_17]|nr:MAG: Release factor glutamine methyltransferase [Parcubacteria group bacterium GW2011_GWA2_43_17]KKT90543.1 MAG: Release factor glutamine methyltransferase [Parcubacteria group bacterium GW2011_GWF2_45_11]HAH04567.1 peptide chain release factor N(5)-glutamine methyltransferase [Candidatus Komeilibacteria bacterium]HBR13452.1 peptide chain release factor N(5)-glutamine methyltransferase [Candidatus Komeilibacteria bacterium]HBV01950.1 peptide chain release factor N(5)-glutamine methyltransfer